MSKSKHTHKYQRTTWGKNETLIWKCVLPGCQHYLHKEMILNKVSLCHECGFDFVMSADKLLKVRPRCNECMAGIIRTSGSKKLDDLLKDI